MGEDSKIQWCDHTFNPWTGCTKVSPGCANCYAEATRNRFGFDEWGPGKARKRTSAANWRKPFKWDREAALAGKRARVFCASMADWLDPEAPIEWLADLLNLIDLTPNLDWLLLTKRPEIWRDRMGAVADIPGARTGSVVAGAWRAGVVPDNVWLGTSVEDQSRADERIPALLSIPARVRFLSMEPLLGPVNLTAIQRADGWGIDALRGVYSRHHDEGFDHPAAMEEQAGGPHIDWVIVGGESGNGARPCDVEWVRDIVRQCKVADVACFVKQFGSRAVFTPPDSVTGRPVAMGLRDPKGGDPSEWPQDLRVREFPR
jgi:protein gp37